MNLKVHDEAQHDEESKRKGHRLIRCSTELEDQTLGPAAVAARREASFPKSEAPRIGEPGCAPAEALGFARYGDAAEWRLEQLLTTACTPGGENRAGAGSSLPWELGGG